MSDGYDVQTMTGETVRIIDKEGNPQRGDVLVAEDGSRYVLDYPTGLVISTDAAPVAESGKGKGEPKKEQDGSNQQEQGGDPEEGGDPEQ